MYTALFLFSVLLLWITAANFFTIRRPSAVTQISTPVSVLIPVRNEAENIAELIDCLTKQTHLDSLEIIFIDDSSEDGTGKALREAKANGAAIKIISAPALPNNWLGKPWALQQGYLAARGEIIVTLDADVRLAPTAIAQTVSMLGNREFISAYPRQVALSFSERLVQPLLQWSWMTTVPLRMAERSSRTSLAVANGQFFMVKKGALDKISGFIVIANEVLDDMKLARALITSGAHGGVADGSKLAHTRMYKNFREIKAGYGKSLWSAFATPLGAGVAIAFISLTGIAPIILWFTGNPIGLFTFEIIVITRIFSAKRSGGRTLDSLLHPISSAILIYLIIYSWRMRGQVQWKGRTL
ncbi:HpnB, hopene-associated glycosyltransferase HpnB [Candidatus Nanopelagicaceae bacterium]